MSARERIRHWVGGDPPEDRSTMKLIAIYFGCSVICFFTVTLQIYATTLDLLDENPDKSAYLWACFYASLFAVGVFFVSFAVRTWGMFVAITLPPLMFAVSGILTGGLQGEGTTTVLLVIVFAVISVSASLAGMWFGNRRHRHRL